MDEAGAIQYKDKMHIDWLNDFLEWTPILLMVLVAVVFLVALKWRSGRMKKFLEEWKRKIVRQAEAGNPSAQFRLGRIYQEGDGVEKDPDRGGGVVSQGVARVEAEGGCGRCGCRL